MLLTVEVLLGEASLVIPVANAAEDAPYVVRNIEGLGPVDADVNSKAYGTIDGEFVSGTRQNKRNIVLTLGFNDISADLPLLYTWLMPKNGALLRFTFNNRAPVTIEGVVESMNPNHFSQDPEAQISIICPQPNFIGEAQTVTGPVETTAFSGVHEVNYNGNRDASVQIDFPVGGTGWSGNLEIRHSHSVVPGQRRFAVEGIIVPAARKILYGTYPGKKHIRYDTQIGAFDMHEFEYDPTNLLYAMTDDSVWITLWPGMNYISVLTSEGDPPPSRTWTIRYLEQFGGV